MSEFITWQDQQWAVPDRINQRLVYKFLTLAAKGATTDDVEGAALFTRLLDQCVTPDDADRFERVCDEVRATDEDLLDLVRMVMSAIGERPTSRSSGSAAGPQATPASSAADSSSQVIASLEAKGRPDLALVVLETQEWAAQQRSA